MYIEHVGDKVRFGIHLASYFFFGVPVFWWSSPRQKCRQHSILILLQSMISYNILLISSWAERWATNILLSPTRTFTYKSTKSNESITTLHFIDRSTFFTTFFNCVSRERMRMVEVQSCHHHYCFGQYSCSTCDVINGPSNYFNNMYCWYGRYDATGSHPPIEEWRRKGSILSQITIKFNLLLLKDSIKDFTQFLRHITYIMTNSRCTTSCMF